MAAFRMASLRKPAAGASLLTSEEIGARLEDLERKMERLRSLYESFFLGAERRPPHVPRQELNRLVLETQQLSIRNAALRFRFQALGQRWTLLTTYWNRTLREIESGTYRRDLQKAYRRIAARGQPLTEEEAATLGIPVGRAKAFVAQQNRRWREPGGVGADAALRPPAAVEAPLPDLQSPPLPSPPGATASAGSMNGDDGGADLARLHQAYTAALVGLARPGAPLTLEQLRTKVTPHLTRLRLAHPSARLDLNVVVEDGRVVIRTKRNIT